MPGNGSLLKVLHLKAFFNAHDKSAALAVRFSRWSSQTEKHTFI